VDNTSEFNDILYACDIGYCHGRLVRENTRPLIWLHNNKAVFLPIGFQSDDASVPRVPGLYWYWGNKAHREAHVHDYCYRKDARIYLLQNGVDRFQVFACQTEEELSALADVVERPISRADGDWYLREAMRGRGRAYCLYQGFYLAVKAGAAGSYHKMSVMDKFRIDEEA
jgi:hypothetical protein